MPRQKKAPARRSEAERAAVSWTDRDLELASGAGAATASPLSAAGIDPAQPGRRDHTVVTFSDDEKEEEVITISDDEDDGEERPRGPGVSTTAAAVAAARSGWRGRGKRRGCVPAAEEEYLRVSAELAQFDFYVAVAVREQRSAEDPVVGSLRLTLAERPPALPEADKFWVYVAEDRARAVLYFEWLRRPDVPRGRLLVEETQLLEAEAARPADTWRLLSGAGGGVETVLGDYSAATGELRLDVLLSEKAFVPLRHPSETMRRVNADCRALLRQLLDLPGREYEFLPLGAVDVEALYRRLAARRGLEEDPDGDGDAEMIPDPQHEQLLPQLRPYQRAAVTWMLRRERRPPADPAELHPLYDPVTLGGATVYFCPLGGWAVREWPGAVAAPLGGILADEMGLGKTVEILSLVLNHPRLDAEIPEPLERVSLVAYDSAIAQKKRAKQKRRAWTESDSTSDSGPPARKAVKSPRGAAARRKGRQDRASGHAASDSDSDSKSGSKSGSDSDSGCEWERYVPTASRADRLKKRRSRLGAVSDSDSDSDRDSKTGVTRGFKGFSATGNVASSDDDSRDVKPPLNNARASKSSDDDSRDVKPPANNAPASKSSDDDSRDVKPPVNNAPASKSSDDESEDVKPPVNNAPASKSSDDESEDVKPPVNNAPASKSSDDESEDVKPPVNDAPVSANVREDGSPDVKPSVNGTSGDVKPCMSTQPDNAMQCSGIAADDNVANCIEDVIVRECYGGAEPKDYVRGLGVIPNWDIFLNRGKKRASKRASGPASKRAWSMDSVDEAIEAVVVRVCYDGKPPRGYRPGGRRPGQRSAGAARAAPKAPSDSKRLLQLHYEQTLSEMSACRVRPSLEPLDDPTFSCLCGRWLDQRYRVECGSCGTFQHAHCVGYDVRDPLRGPYFCPQCWSQRPPVRSGATLIISPAAICDQWVQEIHKHIRREGLRVLVYTGVRCDRYIQPQRLASHDLVVTTYAVLQHELNFTEVGRTGGDAGKRRPQRYLPPPSPLLCVDWWRVCLDEAQMVESTTSRTAAMALKLSCVNRWCVTGTPLSRSVDDLYGLMLFLGVDPVWSELWWSQLVYFPYLHGDAAPLDRLLARCLWRTAKADVLDQIDLPEQRERTIRLDFSPVETYFYRRQHEECARAALSKLATFADDSLPLRDLERSTVNLLLRPLLRLRQACCHPQVVRGQFTSLNKSTMTMEELLEQLIRRATGEAEEAHRQRTAAQHGMAALHVVRGEWAEAAELYRAVLRQADEQRGTLSTDMLQRLHALHNLDELMSAGRPIPPTTRDHRLRQEAEQLRTAYVGSHSALVQQALTAAGELAAEVDGHAAKLDASKRPWFAAVLARWAESRPGEVVERVSQQLRDLSSAGSNKEKQADTGVTKRTTALKARVPANTMLERFSSVTGLQRLLLERLTKLAELREDTQQGVGGLVDVQPTELVSAAVDCHLRPSGGGAQQCRLCAAHAVFERYERELFYMAQSRVDASEMGGVEGKISVHGELQRGNWGDNETERVLKLLLGQARQLGMEPTLVQLGGHHLKMLDAMKKEFKSLRKLWRHANDRVSASDELQMAVLRLRTRYVDEPAPDLPVTLGGQQLPTYVIEPHEVDLHWTRLSAERTVTESELRRKLGQRLYLCNLQRSGAEHRDGNPDPCPICETALGSNWSVLQCGHCFCMPCVQRIVEQYSVGGRRGKLKCAICRDITRHSDIAYVNAGSAAPADGEEEPVRVRGSHSTKVEAVVRCVLTILRDEPDAKTLVFATWTDALDVIAGALDTNGVSYRSLHAPGRFQQHLREFRTQPDVSVLLLPVHSGANGLNLTEATHVVLTHPVLDPGAERQAIGRVHRIGQRRATVVHRLVVRDTIEERVLALNAVRPTAAEAAAPGTAEQGLTLADLRTLFADGSGHRVETEDGS